MYHVSQRTRVDVGVMNAAVVFVSILPVSRTFVVFAKPLGCLSVYDGAKHKENRAAQTSSDQFNQQVTRPVCEDVVFDGPWVELVWDGYRVRDTEHLPALHRFWRSDHPGHLQTWTRDHHRGRAVGDRRHDHFSFTFLQFIF